MRISDVRLESRGEADEASANFDGFRFRYRIPSGSVRSVSADAFLPMALLPAMARGEALEVAPDSTASPDLLAGIERIQRLFAFWVAELRVVPVSARAGPPAPPTPGIASFFSGGVDSLYTFFSHYDEISHLVQIHGFDYRLQNRELVRESEAANRAFAEAHGRTLLVVESNLREWFEPARLHPVLYFGAMLAGVGLLLGFGRIYVPASYTSAWLIRSGSHPLLDPLWSNGSVGFVHDGLEADRVGKMRFLGGRREALANLRVCLDNSTYNCGSCEKCLRTRAGLRILGLESGRLRPLERTAPVYRLTLDDETHRRIWGELQEEAERAGDRRLAGAIAFARARADLRKAALGFDRALFGGKLRTAVKALRGSRAGRPPGASLIRVDTGD